MVLPIPNLGTLLKVIALFGMMGSAVYAGVQYHVKHETRHETLVSIDKELRDAVKTIGEYIIEDRKKREEIERWRRECERLRRWCIKRKMPLEECPFPEAPHR